MVIYNKYFLLSLSLYKARENVECKSTIAYDRFYPFRQQDIKLYQDEKECAPIEGHAVFLATVCKDV